MTRRPTITATIISAPDPELAADVAGGGVTGAACAQARAGLNVAPRANNPEAEVDLMAVTLHPLG